MEFDEAVMDRRKFLSMLALGAPAAVIAPKLALIERARKYFFAPRQGWHAVPGRIDSLTMDRWFRAEPVQLYDVGGNVSFPAYGASGSLDLDCVSYVWGGFNSMPIAPPNQKARIFFPDTITAQLLALGQ